MSETCAQPEEHASKARCSTLRKARSTAARLWRGTGRSVHIWCRDGEWHVGWRYVAPCELPPASEPA